jgi:hypothetical protein
VKELVETGRDRGRDEAEVQDLERLARRGIRRRRGLHAKRLGSEWGAALTVLAAPCYQFGPRSWVLGNKDRAARCEERLKVCRSAVAVSAVSQHRLAFGVACAAGAVLLLSSCATQQASSSATAPDVRGVAPAAPQQPTAAIGELKRGIATQVRPARRSWRAGVKPVADRDDVQLYRTRPDGQREVLTYSVNDFEKGARAVFYTFLEVVRFGVGASIP